MEKQKQGGKNLAAEIVDLYESVRREYERRVDAPNLPSINPDEDDYLEQLFAWCDAYIESSGISDEAFSVARERASALIAKKEGSGSEPCES